MAHSTIEFTLTVSDPNPDSDSKQLDSDSDSRKMRWIRIRADSDSRLLDSDPVLDSRCPDSHITGLYHKYVRYFRPALWGGKNYFRALRFGGNGMLSPGLSLTERIDSNRILMIIGIHHK